MAVVLCLCVLPIGCRLALADEGQSRGFWKLDKSKTKWEHHEDGSDPPYSWAYRATELSHFYKEHGDWEVTEDGATSTGPHVAIFETTCSAPPDVVEGGGDCSFTLTMKLVENSRPFYHFSAYASIRRDVADMNIGGVYAGYSSFTATKEGDPDTLQIAALEDWNRLMDTIPDAGLRTGAGYTQTTTVHNRFPNSDSDRCCVYFSSTGCQTVWTYQWVDTEVVATEEEEIQEVRDPLIEQNTKTEASKDPGSQESGIFSRVFSEFDPSEGGIWDVLGPATLVVIGGVTYRVWKRRRKKGADGKDAKKQKSEEKPTVRYRMVVTKDFGGALRPGGRPRTVRARIEESRSVAGSAPTPFVPSSKTADIRGTAENNLEVSAAPAKGDDKCFSVAVPKDGADKGDPVLRLSIEGAGGSFCNHVKFRLAKDPRLEFERGEGDPEGLEPNVRDLVGVVGATTRVHFRVVEAVGEPSGFAFAGDQGLKVTVEPVPGRYLSFVATIENTGLDIEKRAGVFASLEERTLTLRALFEDEPEAAGDVRLTVWPDGVSVHADAGCLRDDALEVKTLYDLDRLARGEGMPTPPVNFELYCAYVDERGSHVARNPRDAAFEGPVGGERYANMFRENFALEVERNEPGLLDTTSGYSLKPSCALPMLADPYRVGLVVAATLDGRPLDAEIPLSLLGDAPLAPSTVGKEEAIERMRVAVASFGLSNSPEMRRQLRHCQEMSAAQVEFVHKAIIVQGQLFYQEYRISQESYADNCNRWTVVMGAVTKCCDFALEVIAKVKYPSCGETIAKLTNPVRNMVGTYLGMRYGFFGVGDEVRSEVPEDIEEQFVDSLLEGAQSAINGLMSAEEKPSVAVMADLVAIYLAIGFVRHYTRGPGKEKGDAYLSLIKVFTDLTFEKLTSWILGLAGKSVKWLYDQGRGLARNAAKMTNDFIGRRCAGVYRMLFTRDISRQLDTAGEEAFRRVLNRAKEGGAYDSALKDLDLDGLRSLKAQGFMRDLRNRAHEASGAARAALVEEYDDMLREGATNTGRAVTGWLNHVEGTMERDMRQSAREVAAWAEEQTSWGAKHGELVDVVVGQALNVTLGGDKKEGDSLGTKSSEVLQAYLKDRFDLTGICDNAVDWAAAKVNPDHYNVRLDGEFLVFEAGGGSCRVNIIENFEQLGDKLIGSLLVWMFEVFDPIVRSIDLTMCPDPRDDRIYQLRMMEMQHERDSTIMRRGTTEFSRDSFLPGSERPTFDLQIDPHRYMK